MEPAEIRSIDIAKELEALAPLEGRTKDTPLEEADAAFAVLSPYRDGGVFAGTFSGASPWERHPSGDEFVHALGGAATLTVLTVDGPKVLDLVRGTVVIVPKGLWHRFEAPEGVTVMTITPHPTEHSDADDPSGNVPG